jgi:hypothetical protein
MSPSFANKPVDCDIEFNTDNLAGKTAIVTGGKAASHLRQETQCNKTLQELVG